MTPIHTNLWPCVAESDTFANIHIIESTGNDAKIDKYFQTNSMSSTSTNIWLWSKKNDDVMRANIKIIILVYTSTKFDLDKEVLVIRIAIGAMEHNLTERSSSTYACCMLRVHFRGRLQKVSIKNSPKEQVFFSPVKPDDPIQIWIWSDQVVGGSLALYTSL